MKRNPTPNSFSSSVTVAPDGPACGTGMNIFPPAKKVPSCPLTAMMVGSARIFTSPFLISASMETALAPRARDTAPAPPASNCVSSPKRIFPPLTREAVAVASKRAPRRSSTVFDTSAILTSSMTCAAAEVPSKLTTLRPPNCSVSATARCTLTGSETTPVNTSESPAAVTTIDFSSGIRRRKISSTPTVSMLTATSMMVVRPSLLHKKTLVVPVRLPRK